MQARIAGTNPTLSAINKSFQVNNLQSANCWAVPVLYLNRHVGGISTRELVRRPCRGRLIGCAPRRQAGTPER